MGKAGTMMGRLGAAMMIATMVTAGAAQAQTADRLVVVELYTSQGCSSCPPADAILHDLAGMDGVLALALHVDYWDYIGWTDSFGQAAFTARQESYARAGGENTIYTPQMIVGGLDAVVGADAMAVMAGVRAHAALGPMVALQVTAAGGRLRIEARNLGGVTAPVLIQLVRYLPLATVEITRGENAGQTLAYANVVTSWQLLGRWDGLAPLVMESSIAGTDRAAIVVQEQGPGLILAAAQLD